jgi:hypothetical protein
MSQRRRDEEGEPQGFTWWREIALIGSALGAVALVAGVARLLMPPVNYAANYREAKRAALSRIRKMWTRATGVAPSDEEAAQAYAAVLRTIEQYLDVALAWHSQDIEGRKGARFESEQMGWVRLEQMYVAVFRPRAVASRRAERGASLLVFGPRELSMLFGEAGMHKTALVNHLFTQIDVNHNKEIDFVEFLGALGLAKAGAAPYPQLEFVFKCIDVDGNGFVSEQEVSHFLAEYCGVDPATRMLNLGDGALVMTDDALMTNWWRAMTKSSSTAHPIRKAEFENHLHWPGKDLEREVIESVALVVAHCIPLQFCTELCQKEGARR